MSKVVLVTGGSSGIGKSICEYLQANGYTVYGTSRNPERYPNSKIELLQLDVLEIESISNAVEEILNRENRIDVVINNAGAGITGPIEETPDAEIKRNFETNLFGPIRVMQAVLPAMRQQSAGTIINITSIAGYMGLPYRGIYSASKASLEVLTEAIRMEVKDFNIKVVNLAPGDFATNIAAGRYHAPVVENSAYKKSYSQVLKAIDADVNKGNDPLKVAEEIKRIIETANPKIHYKVGAFMQKFSIVMKRILPDLWYEKLLLNHYKL